MDTLMMTVTGLSLAMALGMGCVVARLVREERQRSDARVAALIDMAAEPPSGGQPSRLASGSAPQPRREREARVNQATARSAERAAPAGALDELEIRPADGTVSGGSDLFKAREQSVLWRGRLVSACVIVIVAAGLWFGVLSRGLPADAPAATAVTNPGTAPGAAPPLELLALDHTLQNGSISINGLVQNPRGGQPLTSVVATALVFGADGSVLSSARAPIDYTTIGPGDESPFVVTVPVAGEVTRYRIGFRSVEDRVIGHVDKRGDTIARR